MAEPLARYLSEDGSYDGFDVVAEAIESCKKEIASRHPNFRFRHVDVFNRVYNPTGRLKPESFDFPYAEEAFEFVFLTSVFTHMLPPAVSNYLSEIRRVLRPEGRCLMTAFILDEASLAATRAGRATRRFMHEGDGYFYDVPDRPEAAIAYRDENFLRLLDQARLELCRPVTYGYWRVGHTTLGPGQDLLVVRPIR
jgi:SAM-dependent methyltransferase